MDELEDNKIETFRGKKLIYVASTTTLLPIY